MSHNKTRDPLKLLARRAQGQATVEAAFLIPVLMLLMLFLTQPLIVLYNQMIMESAAAEGCRLMATATQQGDYSTEKYRDYIKRRLAAIPPLPIFHVPYSDSEDWDIYLYGDENTGKVVVSISNEVQPLPLVGSCLEFTDFTESNGYIAHEVYTSMPTQPAWVVRNGGPAPQDWVYNYD